MTKKYRNLLRTNASSVINQVHIVTNHLPVDYRCLVVHTLKSQANPKNPEDRYIMHIFSQETNTFNDLRSSYKAVFIENTTTYDYFSANTIALRIKFTI